MVQWQHVEPATVQYSDSNFAHRNNFSYRKSRNLCEKFESDNCRSKAAYESRYFRHQSDRTSEHFRRIRDTSDIGTLPTTSGHFDQAADPQHCGSLAFHMKVGTSDIEVGTSDMDIGTTSGTRFGTF